MIDYGMILLINALYIVGVYLAFGNDMILEPVGNWLEERIPYNLTKPLFNCPTCMASLHSWVYWMFNDFTELSVVFYIIYIPALATVSTLIANKTE